MVLCRPLFLTHVGVVGASANYSEPGFAARHLNKILSPYSLPCLWLLRGDLRIPYTWSICLGFFSNPIPSAFRFSGPPQNICFTTTLFCHCFLELFYIHGGWGETRNERYRERYLSFPGFWSEEGDSVYLTCLPSVSVPF